MNQSAAVFVVGFVLACSTDQGSNSSERPKALSAEEAAILNDSIETVIATYEAGGLAFNEASKQLADLVEPLGGFAYQGNQSPKVQRLFYATGRELRRREAQRHGVPDSLLKD
jgi:hypothetical protein